MDASTTIQWTISAPDRLAVLSKRWLHRESVDDGFDVDNDDISEDDDISSRQTRCTFQNMRSLHTVLMMMAVMMAMTKMTAAMILRTLMVTVLLDVVLANERITIFLYTDGVEISQNQPSFCSSLYRSRPLD